MPVGIWKVLGHYDIVYFITGRPISNRLGVAAVVLWGLKDESLTHSINDEGVCRAAPGQVNRQAVTEQKLTEVHKERNS